MPIVWAIPHFQKSPFLHLWIILPITGHKLGRIGQFMNRVRPKGGLASVLAAPTTDLLILGWIDILSRNYSSSGTIATHQGLSQARVPHLILNI